LEDDLICALSCIEPRLSDVLSLENDCKLMLYITTKYVFETVGGEIFQLPPWLRPGFLTTNRLGLRTDCSENLFLFLLYMYNNCRNGEVVQSMGCGFCVCWLTGSHAWKCWECLLYSFQGIKQKLSGG